jgi:hypothetical protein
MSAGGAQKQARATVQKMKNQLVQSEILTRAKNAVTNALR